MPHEHLRPLQVFGGTVELGARGVAEFMHGEVVDAGLLEAFRVSVVHPARPEGPVFVLAVDDAPGADRAFPAVKAGGESP